MLSVTYYFWMLNKFRASRKIFVKVPNLKFHERPSSGAAPLPPRQTEMMKLTGAIRDLCELSQQIGTLFHPFYLGHTRRKVIKRFFNVLLML